MKYFGQVIPDPIWILLLGCLTWLLVQGIREGDTRQLVFAGVGLVGVGCMLAALFRARRKTKNGRLK